MKEQVILKIGKKTIIFDVKDFGNSAVDTEELLQVDINAIVADMITFPVLFNRIGIVKAEMDNFLRETQLDFDVFCAEQRKEARKIFSVEIDSKGKEKRKYLTEQGIDDEVLLSQKYKVKKQDLNRVKFQTDIIDALYWSAKSKDTKLNAISAKIKPEDFEYEIIEGVVNDVQIRIQKNHFEERKR